METVPTPSVLDQRELDTSRMPYQLPFPAEAADEDKGFRHGEVVEERKKKRRRARE